MRNSAYIIISTGFCAILWLRVSANWKLSINTTNANTIVKLGRTVFYVSPLMQPSVQQPISKDKNVMARTRKYSLKNHYLTLRSKVNVTQRSLQYVTHRLMVMHPHTKYHWPISKDKKVMVWTSFAEKKRKKQKKR